MMDDDDIFGSDESDTVERPQGDRDTQTSSVKKRRSPPPFASGQIAGVFEFERLLGQGSSGCVYRAFDTVAQRHCALKVLTPKDPQDLRRNTIGFRRMNKLSHPNLTRMGQMYQLEEHCALSMEEIQGETLAKTRKRYRLLEPHIAHNKILGLIRHFAAGLAAMHSSGLVHRDIKPSNLMVDRNDRGRLIDYGLVGQYDAESDAYNYRDYLVGTIRFIAPESLYDQRYSPAGDIFSLGLVMLEFLNAITGRRAWQRNDEDRDDDAERINKAVDGISNSVPQILHEACLEMTQINPADRPTARQIARLGLPTSTSLLPISGQPLVGRNDEFETVCEWLSGIYVGDHGRFHIHGPSGIGKTQLINAIEKHLVSLRWGQVFRAKCQPREDQPLQAFGQIALQVATRYASNDREPMQVDSVSAEHLYQAFPVLKDVVKKNIHLPGIVTTNNARDNVLKAAASLVAELKKMGPLTLIIDDVQWADADTQAVLDYLQSSSGEMLGIITVSRQEKSLQRRPPNETLRLQPLRDEDALKMLSDAAKRASVKISRQALQELCEAASGNPFRLSELANEFRPGGILHNLPDPNESSVSNIGNLDRLWEMRVSRLSPDARRILAFIVTASHSVSVNQLASLDPATEHIEIAVSELANHRLVTDDATGGECIDMIHDRISEGVVSCLSESERLHANLAWADLLRTQSHDGELDGRIARHLIDANKSNEALPYARQAGDYAHDAFAYSEAAEWFQKVCQIYQSHPLPDSDQHQYEYTLKAAKCWAKAEQPMRAAEIYQQLADSATNPELKLQHSIKSVELTIHSGRFSKVEELFGSLCDSLDLPRIDQPIGQREAAIRGFRVAREMITSADTNQEVAQKPASKSDQIRSDFCLSLIKPMMMVDGLYACRLFVALSETAKSTRRKKDDLSLLFGSAVFAGSDKGSLRIRAESMLRQQQAVAIDLGPKSAGDYWAARALVHAFAMDWRRVRGAVKSLAESSAVGHAHTGFVGWLELWADWYQGNWNAMEQRSNELMTEHLLRDDMHGHLSTTYGLGASVWFAQDNVDAWDRFDQINTECFSLPSHIVDCFGFIARCQKSIYLGDFQSALEQYEQFDKQISSSLLSRFQLARVVVQQLGSLAALHLFNATGFPQHKATAEIAIGKLRKEQLPCAEMMADFYSGISYRISGDHAKCRQYLVAASQLAKELELLPFQLAAEDNLGLLENGESLGRLNARMRNRGVKDPDAFQRLYSVETA